MAQVTYIENYTLNLFKEYLTIYNNIQKTHVLIQLIDQL